MKKIVTYDCFYCQGTGLQEQYGTYNILEKGKKCVNCGGSGKIREVVDE